MFGGSFPFFCSILQNPVLMTKVTKVPTSVPRRGGVGFGRRACAAGRGVEARAGDSRLKGFRDVAIPTCTTAPALHDKRNPNNHLFERSSPQTA